MSQGRSRTRTHEIFNQPPALAGGNLYEQDAALQSALHREGGGWAEDRVRAYGQIAGHELFELGFPANENPPLLRTHDRFGRRIDHVSYHPSYHRLMKTALANGLHNLPWTEARKGAHAARAAMFYLHAQAEAGTCCPVTMTFASYPVLREQRETAEFWGARIAACEYDGRDVPAAEKAGATIGMAMTEKQGGSDVRSNTTRAVPESGNAYRLTGHKWFCSAPMSDAFLVLAQTEGGLSCFLLPRWQPDGTRNAVFIQRLKEKLGNRSNASAEVEFDGAHAVPLGKEGRGVATILRMVALTRFDCITGSAALMRQAAAQALHHARFRNAFGRSLAEQPLMQNVLADLAVESEAALVYAMRVARALDNAEADENERLFSRIATAVGKYWVCKRAPGHVYEAAECLGGNGYVEESIMPRLYREAPVNAIWEGCGNIQALDLLRTLEREPGAHEAVFREIEAARGASRDLDELADALRAGLSNPTEAALRSRRLIEATAIALQASLLFRHAPPAVADAFAASRLAASRWTAYGTLPPGLDLAAIMERAAPQAP